jgi:hypothetical protein
LLDEIIKYGLREFDFLLHSQAQKADALDQENFVGLLSVFFETIKSKIKIWRLFIKIALEPGAAQIGYKYIADFSGHLDMIFVRYFEAQGFDNPRAKSQVAGAMLHGAFLSYILHSDDEIFEMVKNEIIEKFVLH